MKATADYQTPDRMSAKLAAIPLPDLKRKRVLDVGCDERFWCDLAWERGAKRVLGVDRGRSGHNGQWINRSDYTMDVGKQWHELGKFDVVFLFSLYHHIFQSAGGDHKPIWYWLWRQLDKGGEVIWENPTDTSDPVVQANVDKEYHKSYHRIAILNAAHKFFDIEYVGPARHVPTREVYAFKRKELAVRGICADMRNGAGGATKAFLYQDGRRIKEIAKVLDITPYPGSLNLFCYEDFDWNQLYYRAQILDVKDRAAGFDSEWAPRWMRFYPVRNAGLRAFALRFEGESYPENFVELISNVRLRDYALEKPVVWIE